MIRIERHPLVRRDLRELARHVANVSGDLGAAERRLDQVDALLTDILANPNSGAFLSTELPGWRVRHGGADQRITIEPPRVSERVKISKDDPYGIEEANPEVHGRVPRARRSAVSRTPP